MKVKLINGSSKDSIIYLCYGSTKLVIYKEEIRTEYQIRQDENGQWIGEMEEE